MDQNPGLAPATPIDTVIHDLCRYLEAHAEEPIRLSDLAARAGYSPSHLQKRFTAIVGTSPRAYQRAVRIRNLKAGLREGAAPLPAVLEAGFGSTSRVYGDLGRTLGMTPGEYQKGGASLTIHWTTTPTPLGLMGLGATDRGLCFLQFGDNAGTLKEKLKAEFPLARLEPMPATASPFFSVWERALEEFFAGTGSLETLPLDLQGTAFQIAVWRFLQSIPRGTTVTYSQVATGIGQPKAVRAVGTACGRNTVALLVPCHRVIRGDGHLGGYRWGVERKQRLLDLERNQP